MRQFFDPSLLPITTTDLDGNVLYVKTNGLHHYGYTDIMFEGAGEEGEQLLLDILDRIFSLEFNINSTWNYNGNLLKLEQRDDGFAHIVYCKVDQPRILTILNPQGEPAKYISKGLSELYGHPEAEVDGDTIHGKDILSHLIDEVVAGTRYDEDSLILNDDHVYSVAYTMDRLGNPVLQIHLEPKLTEKPITKRSSGHLKRIK
ncbi:hypothetical protein [Cohnella soli]|uniref:Uncharacterized protein n=1 Tax=Cohnella soli TaxID=425005 RepID=A0ABW0HPK8_9BACL